MMRMTRSMTQILGATVLLLGATCAARAQDNVVEYDAAMETLGTYAHQTTEAKTRLTLVYISALANFETTVQQASREEAKADLVGVALKSGWNTAKGLVTAAVTKSTGVDVAPLVALYDAVDGEIDRAAAASTSLAAGEWIKKLRSTLTDNYAKDNSGAYLQQLKEYYGSLDPDERFDWITSVQVELESLKSFVPPKTDAIELALYEGWLWSFYEHCGGDPDPHYGGTIGGVVRIMFDEEDDSPVLEAVCIKAPLGDKIQSGIERVMTGSVMGLNAVKQVCFYGTLVAGGRGYTCGCLGRDNRIISRIDLPPYGELLESRSWTSQVNGFYGGYDKCK